MRGKLSQPTAGEFWALMLDVQLIVYCLPVVLFLILCYVFACFRQKSENFCDEPSVQHVGIVIAHPDDECMFFSPLLLDLNRRGKSARVLCVSTGNYAQQGSIRQRELQRACLRMGIMKDAVSVVDDPLLPDHQDIAWDLKVVSRHIMEFLKDYDDIDTLVTFDEQGVSGHTNHIAVHKAVARLVSKGKISHLGGVYCLQSVGLFRKYSQVLDTVHTILMGKNVFVSSPQDYFRAVHAMKAHQSQLLWFRRLYLVFSRYMFMNDYVDISKPG